MALTVTRLGKHSATLSNKYIESIIANGVETAKAVVVTETRSHNLCKSNNTSKGTRISGPIIMATKSIFNN